jgi:hypothetical protein
MIYFAQINIPGGPIKIGTAKDVQKRVRQFEKSMPWRLKVIATFPGNRKVEKWLHERFFRFRMTKSPGREWFYPDEELLFWMDNIITTPTQVFFDPHAKFVREGCEEN